MRVRLHIDVEVVPDVITMLAEIVVQQPPTPVQIPGWEPMIGRLMDARPVEGSPK